MKMYRIVAAAALIATTSLPLHATQSDEARLGDIKRTNLMKEDLSVPGREVVQVRVDFRRAWSLPGITIRAKSSSTSSKARWSTRSTARPPVTVRAGEVLFIPHGTHHEVKNVGSTNAAELATYIVEKGEAACRAGRVSARANDHTKVRGELSQ